MARALESILAELNNVYNPQRDVVNQQMSQLDPQQQAENQGLEAAKTDAFSQITDQANRRGLFYSGIPVQEEQRYTGATFLPAVANLKAKYAQQRFNLQDTLAKITQDQYLKGQDIYQTEMDRDSADARARAAAAGQGAASPSFGFGGGAAPTQGGGGVGYAKRPDGGFNFVGPDGRAISAAQYAASTGTPFRSLLQWMANQGDKGAGSALGFVGNDLGYDPNKIGNNGGVYNSLVWGTGRTYRPSKSQQYSGLLNAGGQSTTPLRGGGGGW